MPYTEHLHHSSPKVIHFGMLPRKRALGSFSSSFENWRALVSLIQHQNCRRIVFVSAERLLLGWIVEGRIWDDDAKSYIKRALSNRTSISFVVVLFPLETPDVQACAEQYQQTGLT